MSKTDASLGPLVGILRFDIPAKSTRTLSATQAHDISRSQIVLGSFTGKFTDKTATEKDYANWTVALTTYRAGGSLFDGDGATGGVKRDDHSVITPATGTLSLSATSIALDGAQRVAPKERFGIPPVVTFSGATGYRAIQLVRSSNSKATNSNTIYYGAITVGLGEYKKWQGNYAVLKINTVTEKAVLRIYVD